MDYAEAILTSVINFLQKSRLGNKATDTPIRKEHEGWLVAATDRGSDSVAWECIPNNQASIEKMLLTHSALENTRDDSSSTTI